MVFLTVERTLRLILSGDVWVRQAGCGDKRTFGLAKIKPQAAFQCHRQLPFNLHLTPPLSM